jgi:hypothetical protein
MESPCLCACESLSFHQLLNDVTTVYASIHVQLCLVFPPLFITDLLLSIELCVYIMATERISTAYFVHPFYQSMYVYICIPSTVVLLLLSTGCGKLTSFFI